MIEVERAQIAHEIHDSLLPLIFAASAAVSSLHDRSSETGSEETRKKLEQIAQWLNSAMQTGRRLLTQVYPPELTGTLWTPVAADALERLCAETSVEIRWQIDPKINETSAPIALAAYRIVVEAVRNAIAHGKASEVVVRGEKQTNAIRIAVQDNGRGFDPSQVSPDRFGIRSMTGRANLVGGTLTVDSAPGGPTTVTFLVSQNPK